MTRSKVDLTLSLERETLYRKEAQEMATKYRTALRQLADRFGLMGYEESYYYVDDLVDDLMIVSEAQDAKAAEERLTPKKTTTKK